MSAAEQTTLDLEAPVESAATHPTPRAGHCDLCGLPTRGESFGVMIDWKMMLVCRACDRKAR